MKEDGQHQREWGEHEAIVGKLAQKCSFMSIRKVKDLSGRSGAQTFFVQPESVDGPPLPAILKIGPAAIIRKDLDGLQRIQSQFFNANYKLAEETESDVWAVLLQLAGEKTCRSFEEYYLDSGTTPELLSSCITHLFDSIMRVDTRNLQHRKNPFAQYTFHAPDRQSGHYAILVTGCPLRLDGGSELPARATIAKRTRCCVMATFTERISWSAAKMPS